MYGYVAIDQAGNDMATQAVQCRVAIMADITIRLWQLRLQLNDAGKDQERYEIIYYDVA